MPVPFFKPIKTLIASFFLLYINTTLANTFDFGENTIEPSPNGSKTFLLQPGETVIDFDVSPRLAAVALIIKTAIGSQKVLFWNIGSPNSQNATRVLTIPVDTQLTHITWHPEGQSLFMLGKNLNTYQIIKTQLTSWDPTVIHQSSYPLEKLIFGPRPFEIGLYDDKTKTTPISYRLFFGIKNQDGNYTTHTISEEGHKEYSVLNSKSHSFEVAKAEFDMNEEKPSSIIIPTSARPVSFHPAGTFMIWEDEKGCFQKVLYGRENWGQQAPIFKGVTGLTLCGGSLHYTPNGAMLLHWQPGVDGVDMLFDQGKGSERVAKGGAFLTSPLSVPDGKGLVGIIQDKDKATTAIKYIPIAVPLADVTNAWMFLESPNDRTIFSKNNGLFRELKSNQLYDLYDSESYYCGGYDRGTPTRPYLVTTDVFLELYASAFEGIFVLTERTEAMPAFWQFVQTADNSLKSNPNTKMAKAFAALIAVRDGVKENAEAIKIMEAKGTSTSTVTNESFDYSELQPRGHYTTNKSLASYFRASKYLMNLKLDTQDRDLLQKLPTSVNQQALSWINAYRPFIALSKRPLIWETTTEFPNYLLHPDKKAQVFPLSWGIDNEVLFSTVYHRALPVTEQIMGPEGQRLLPSGLDIAAVLGSSIAESILESSGEFKKYPPLKTQLDHLKARYESSKNRPSDSLYQKWLSTLATQWSENISSPGDTFKKPLWSRKRLQTGLASWATLRHTTVLVNERSAAECGEGGFEPIILRPPRGYVEPDVETFEKIANLFEATSEMIRRSEYRSDHSKEIKDIKDSKNIWEGVLRRLAQSRDKVRLFRDIAKKEVKGQPLTNKEYEEILFVGRVAEHNFLIFKSLAAKDFALSNPEPIEKVADVAAAPGTYLLAGVGHPLEWDQIVPFFGRKEIVKGPVYSYHEQASNTLMDDKQWRSLVGLSPPSWILPFMSKDKLSCPAKEP